MSQLQIVTYGGNTVAACTAQRFFLTDELAARPPGDPRLTFVVMMCAYALDVAAGVLPGPYNESDARRYARACLIPDELLERPALDNRRAARALGVPVEELRVAQREREHSCPRADAEFARGEQRAPRRAPGWSRGA